MKRKWLWRGGVALLLMGLLVLRIYLYCRPRSFYDVYGDGEWCFGDTTVSVRLMDSDFNYHPYFEMPFSEMRALLGAMEMRNTTFNSSRAAPSPPNFQFLLPAPGDSAEHLSRYSIIVNERLFSCTHIESGEDFRETTYLILSGDLYDTLLKLSADAPPAEERDLPDSAAFLAFADSSERAGRTFQRREEEVS